MGIALRISSSYASEHASEQKGGSGFLTTFKQNRPTNYSIDVKKMNGYNSFKKSPRFLNMGKKGVWIFQSMFLTGSKPGATPNVSDCKLIKVKENWILCHRWVAAVRIANEIINAGRPPSSPKILQVLDGPQTDEFGVIGFDTPLSVPDWAKTLFPSIRSWSDSKFPSLTEQRRIQFGKSGQYCSTAERVLSYVRSKLEGQYPKFATIFTTQLTDRTASYTANFLSDAGVTCGLAAWGHHARILYKDEATKTLKVYDPWKQNVTPPSWLKSYAENAGYTVTFVVREAEQQVGEGSCQLQATMRVLMASQMGEFGISAGFNLKTNPEIGIYPVVTQLLYTQMRPRRR